MGRVRVLVVDDSALMRQTLRRLIAASPDLELAGMARDGESAVAKARELRPDVVSMDIHMPGMDGISALQTILHERICPVVMVSSLTQKGAIHTFQCLELGAFDFVAKPDGTISADLSSIAGELVVKWKAAAAQGVGERAARPRSRLPVIPLPHSFAKPVRQLAVAIGCSTGGPATLQEVLPRLPAHLPASVFLVQHMPPPFVQSFARRLAESCAIRVLEAQAGMRVEPGVCYVAPGGLHLCPHQRLTGEVVIRTPGSPLTLFVPSVNVMMAAVLKVYGPDTVGVLMTGIGDDGAEQMAAIRRCGGHTIAESAETAVVFGMPREAVERGGASVVAPSYEIAGQIMSALERRVE